MDLAVKSYDALVSYLVKPAKNETDRIRAIFTWITSQRLHIVLDFTDGDLPPSGTPLHNLLSVLIQRSFNGYSELLAEMCRYEESAVCVFSSELHWFLLS